MHHHWSRSWCCSMMSLQIMVWPLWIAALSVPCCCLKWVDVWRQLHFIGLVFPSSSFLPTCPPPTLLYLLLSLPLTFPYSGLLQSANIMEAGCVVAAVIENAASGPRSEPGSSDILERWVSVVFCASCQLMRILIQTCTKRRNEMLHEYMQRRGSENIIPCLEWGTDTNCSFSQPISLKAHSISFEFALPLCV